MRFLLRSPKDTIAAGLALVVIGVVVGNALLMQAGRHPSPLFSATVVFAPPATQPARPQPQIHAAMAPAAHADPAPEPETTATAPMPLPRPAEASASAPAAKAVAGKAIEKPADPIGNLVRTTLSAPVPRPPAAIPARVEAEPEAGASRQVAAVQRVLTAYGYGQLKPSGVLNAETQAAIRKFEQWRKLPVTGQVSKRLVHELSKMTGRAID